MKGSCPAAKFAITNPASNSINMILICTFYVERMRNLLNLRKIEIG